jgi:hypothetical protein
MGYIVFYLSYVINGKHAEKFLSILLCGTLNIPPHVQSNHFPFVHISSTPKNMNFTEMNNSA